MLVALLGEFIAGRETARIKPLRLYLRTGWTSGLAFTIFLR